MNATYCGPPPHPDAIWSTFNLDPVLIVGLCAIAVMLRRSPSGLAGVAVLAIAFISPLCPLSAALFSARAVHHLLIVAVAAPLFAAAMPMKGAGRSALPFAVSTIVLWVWHIPAAYDLALSNVAVYWVMQLTLLASAVWFWRSVLARESSPIDSLAFIVAGFMQMGLLGALLTFAPEPLFAAHLFAPLAYGVAPLDDQALGGLIMWVPASIPFAVAAAFVARRGFALVASQGAARC